MIDTISLRIHSPLDYPLELKSDESTTFELNSPRTLEVFVIPEVVTMDENLEELPISQRNCYLKDERKLKFFKFYTQRNCEIECFAGQLLDICGCVPFYMIRNNETVICELYDYLCIN